jgi:hypothetical protein
VLRVRVSSAMTSSMVPYVMVTVGVASDGCDKDMAVASGDE